MKLEKNKLMILGAAQSQVPLIETAKEMNLEVHVCSIKGNYPGIYAADIFHEADITDVEKIYEIAKDQKIDGILTTATDICLESIGYVVDKLNLSGTGLENSKACLNKIIMKQRFSSNNIPTPNYIEVKNYQDAIEFFQKQKSPCVLKPNDSSSSRGVTKIETLQKIEDAYSKALEFSTSGGVIIEEWLEGEEFGAQAIVVNNELNLLIIHSDITTPPPQRIPIGHGCPHPNEKTLFPLISNIVRNAIKALGINNAICNIDFINSTKGPQIIEMTCRMGGTHLPEVCGEYSGINLYKLAIELSLGKIPTYSFKLTKSTNAIHNLIIPTSGYIRKLGMMDNNHQWHIYPKEGDYVTTNASNLVEIGYVHVKGTNPVDVLKEASNLAGVFCDTIEIKEGIK